MSTDRDAEIAALYPSLTMEQIGERFGVSRQRVHQILKQRGAYERPETRAKPLGERFWLKVRKGEGCWEWQGARLPHGYGHLSVPDRGHVNAHRIAWELTNGEIPDGLWVLHHCDNPPCVRPDHLFLGTAQDNVDDSIRKGRRSGGASAHAALVQQLLDEWRESA
jgi:hypothetical protein